MTAPGTSLPTPPGVVRPTAREAARLPTATDVARVAGVSQSAVSRSFTPGASVAAAARARVLAAAEALGYHPNLLARTLTTGRSAIIGVAVGDLANPFYPHILHHLSTRLAATGRQTVLLGPTSLDWALHYRLDGLILAATSLPSTLAQRCAQGGVPVVLLNRTSCLPGIASVLGENAAGAREVARFLLAGRHQRIAFLAGPASAAASLRERAFTGELTRAGKILFRRAQAPPTREGATLAAARLLVEPRPDAVFCHNDLIAMATIDAARALGLAIPADLSVIGFDDTPAAAWPAYALTSFSQPAVAMADAAVALLDLAAGTRRIVPGQLVIRGSARLP